MPDINIDSRANALESRVAALEELLAALERTVVEQSERLERSSAAQSHLAALVQSADAAIISLSLDFRIQSWNPGAERLFGYVARETIGRRPNQVFVFAPERDRAPVEFFKDVEAFRQPAAGARCFEETLQRRDGTAFEASFIASGIYDANHQLTGVSIIVRDISGQKSREREVARLAAIVESSDDAITSIDTNFRITSWNRSAERLFGLNARQVVGQPVQGTLPPKERAQAERNLVEDLAAIRKRRDFVRHLEISLPKKDGTVVEVSLAVSGIYDEAGNAVGMSQIFRDITGRRRAEREQALLAALVKSSDDGIISVGLDGGISSWNTAAEKLFGFSSGQAMGQNLIELLVPPERRERASSGVRREFSRAAQGHPLSVHHPEVPALRSDGSTVEVSVSVSGIYDAAGKPLGASCIVRDISEARRTERDLARLAAIVESSGDAIVSLNLDGLIVSWNRGAEHLFGFSAAEAIGQPATIFIPFEEHPRTAEVMKEIQTNPGRVFNFEAPNLKKDGTIIETSMTIFGTYDRQGNLLGICSTHRDVTERRRAEREQALLAAIVASTDDAVVSLSRDGLITTWNRGAETLLGFAPEEAIGHPITVYLPPQLHALAQEGVRNQLAAARERRTLERLETQLRRKDGTLIDASVVSSGIYDSNGTLIGLSGIIRDVTEHNRAERELARLASIVKASEDAIISVSKELKITSWNPAAEEAYGFSASQALGQGLDLFVPPAEIAQTVAVTRRLIETGQSASWEQHGQRKDGTQFVSAVNIFPTRDAAGNIMEAAGIGRDITRLKDIERDLREAHEYTRGLIESSIDAMIMVDGEMRIIDGNEQLAKLTEIPKKMLFGALFESIFADPQAARRAVRQTFADGYVTNVELAVRSASGREIPVSFNASLFYRAGRVFGIFGVARDVTEQHGIERTLREEREYSRSLVQSSPDALLVCNAELLLTDANEQAVTLTGYPREELIGITLPLLFTEPALAGDVLSKTWQQGRAHDVELQLLTKNAKAIPISLNTSAFKESDSSAHRIVATVRDISERKVAERERSLLASIVDSSGDAIYSETTELTVSSWNPAAERLFGYAGAEIVGRSAALLAPLERRAELIEHARSVRRSGKPESYETCRLRKDGKSIDVAITQSPVRDAAGTIVGLSVTAHDISERRRMEAELAQARDEALEGARLKSEFLANMSHEIRTPLNSVIGMTGLLLDTELTPEQREFAQDVRSSGDALLSLINDILDFSKIAAGKLVFEEVDFDLTDAIESATELVASQARRKDLELTISIDPEVPRLLRGDPGRLRQILLNLLGNAIKFTERGEVGVAVSKLSENPQQANLRFEVHDTGIGIPLDKQKHLFEAFTQVDASTTRRYGGTGLGLSIARELVSAMHGTIAVSSKPGAGSTFWFTITFPKQVDTSKPAAERFASIAGVKVVIVDDNANSRQILERTLSAWGMCARSAASAQEGLALMRSDTFQVALLDVMMPEVDGIGLARRMKADPALAKIAVLFASSVGSRADFGTRLVDLDVGAWLMKPVPESLLYDALVKVLADREVNEEKTGAAPEEPVATQPEAAAASGLLAGRKLKVLLAEDNPINQKVAKLQLAKLGLEVDAVADGREAVEAVSRRPYDVVLMDCQMPEMDGYEATREIRRREGTAQHTNIVAMTAHALPGDREKCLAAGMDGYISKPVKPAALEAILAELFADKPPPQTRSGDTAPPATAPPGALPHPESAPVGGSERAADRPASAGATNGKAKSVA